MRRTSERRYHNPQINHTDFMTEGRRGKQGFESPLMSVKRPCGTLQEVLASRLPDLIRCDITESKVFVTTVLLP
jgi:hypothetical protein